MTEELVTFETAKLAREKGFDENCRTIWEIDPASPGEPQAGYPPTDEKMMRHYRNLIYKYKDNLGHVIRTLDAAAVEPMHNARLPEYVYSRPTQDLLERWLREVHCISIRTECLGMFLESGRQSVYRSTVHRFTDHYVDHTANKTSHEHAREAALLHALKLLP